MKDRDVNYYDTVTVLVSSQPDLRFDDVRERLEHQELTTLTLGTTFKGK